jgi:acyl-coenzyme A thioesterase PaaI-like protein
LDHQFTRRVDIGDFVEAECEIIRAARRLVFVTCTMSVRGKVVGTTTALLNVRGGGDDAE